MKVIVIGKGLIGAATARYFAQAGHAVTVIGPDEPTNKATHRGVFASHYDEARIARSLDSSPFWTRVKAASIARFREIETESGIAFFHEVSGLLAGPEGAEIITKARAELAKGQVQADLLTASDLTERFPMLRFASDEIGFHERKNAGWINPRRLIDAQLTLATRHGAVIHRDIVTGIDEARDGVTVHLSDGTHERADQVVVATGAFVNQLFARALPVQVFARTVLFAEVAPDQLALLSAIPALVTVARGGREPYLLPPIRYPDGRMWLKIGGDPVDIPLSGQEIGDWFRSDGSPEVAAHLRDILARLIPDFRPLSLHNQACAVTFTSRDLPLIDRVSARITVATAGCARGAKASDELGRLAFAAVFGQIDPDCRLVPGEH